MRHFFLFIAVIAALGSFGCGPSAEFKASARSTIAASEALDNSAFDSRSVVDARMLAMERFSAEMKGKASTEDERYIATLVTRYTDSLSHQIKMGQLSGKPYFGLAYASDLSDRQKFEVEVIKSCHDEATAMLSSTSARTGKCDAAFKASIDNFKLN